MFHRVQIPVGQTGRWRQTTVCRYDPRRAPKCVSALSRKEGSAPCCPRPRQWILRLRSGGQRRFLRQGENISGPTTTADSGGAFCNSWNLHSLIQKVKQGSRVTDRCLSAADSQVERENIPGDAAEC